MDGAARLIVLLICAGAVLLTQTLCVAERRALHRTVAPDPARRWRLRARALGTLPLGLTPALAAALPALGPSWTDPAARGGAVTLAATAISVYLLAVWLPARLRPSSMRLPPALTALVTGLALPLAWLALRLVEAQPLALWISFATAGLIVEALLLASPVRVDPRSLAPLDADKRAALEALAHRCGLDAIGIRRVADGSARLNAQLRRGRPPRVLLWDALLRALAPEELQAVVAHELAHLRLAHHRQRLLWRGARWISIALLMAAWWAVSDTPPPLRLSEALALLPLMWLVWLAPLARMQRHYEHEADRFVAGLGLARALATALRKLDASADASSARTYAAFFDSHPSTAEREARLSAAGS